MRFLSSESRRGGGGEEGHGPGNVALVSLGQWEVSVGLPARTRSWPRKEQELVLSCRDLSRRMPGTPGGRAGSGRGRVGLCVETAAGAAGVLWEAPGFGEEGGTLFQAGGGQHGQSDPEATEVGLWPLEAGIDADAGRRRQVGHHLPEVRSQVRGARWAGAAGGGVKTGNLRQGDWKRVTSSMAGTGFSPLTPI